MSPALEHRSVLLNSAVDALLTDVSGIYVDATFGRGGHSRLILQRLAPTGRLIALDRDADAVASARTLADPRFHIEHTPFSRLQATLEALGIGRVHGVLFDLGVSSPQIDDAQRGFSWRESGPLDMRMDRTCGETATEWLRRVDVSELTRVLRDYGEERFAAAVAKAIVARCQGGNDRPPDSRELAAVVASAIPVRNRKDATQHPATRTFQAIRIHINQELEELALALQQAGALLAPAGRLVVISFHSLEDRIVKRFIEAHAHPERSAADRRAPLRADQLPRPTLRALGRQRADEAEMATNPRARSAVMRVAERTVEPWSERR